MLLAQDFILIYCSYISVRILRSDGREAENNELGRIVVKLPLPPGTMSTLYQAPERFCQIYFTEYPVSIVFCTLHHFQV